MRPHLHSRPWPDSTKTSQLLSSVVFARSTQRSVDWKLCCSPICFNRCSCILRCWRSSLAASCMPVVWMRSSKWQMRAVGWSCGSELKYLINRLINFLTNLITSVSIRILPHGIPGSLWRLAMSSLSYRSTLSIKLKCNDFCLWKHWERLNLPLGLTGLVSRSCHCRVPLVDCVCIITTERVILSSRDELDREIRICRSMLQMVSWDVYMISYAHMIFHRFSFGTLVWCEWTFRSWNIFWSTFECFINCQVSCWLERFLTTFLQYWLSLSAHLRPSLSRTTWSLCTSVKLEKFGVQHQPNGRRFSLLSMELWSSLALFSHNFSVEFSKLRWRSLVLLEVHF